MLTAVKSLGEKLKELREASGLSLRALSARLDGLSAAHLSDIERGRRYPSKDLLVRLAEEFGVDTAELDSFDTRRVGREARRRADADPAFTLKLRSLLESRDASPEFSASVPLAPPTTPSARPPDNAAIEVVLRLIASGLVELYQTFESTGKPPQASYSRKLQMGLDKLAAACVIDGVPPPQSVPDILRLCERPFSEWPLPSLPEEVSPQDTLLRNQVPSFFCEDYAREDRDIEAALSEERFMKKVLIECSGLPPSVYTQFRELLVTCPVLTEREFFNTYMRPPLKSVADLVKEAYEEAPAFLAHNGVFRCCPECGNLLIFRRGQGWFCLDEGCSTEQVFEDMTPRTLSASGEDRVFQLKRSLRRYVAAPGRAEVRIRDQLLALRDSDRKLSVELWPNVDAYDLRLTFSDRQVWAVDVKDWASPYRLADQVKPFRINPPWDRAFFVFPDRHRHVKRNYVEAFKSRCLHVGDRVDAMFQSDFIAAARRKIRGGT